MLTRTLKVKNPELEIREIKVLLETNIKILIKLVRDILD